MATSTGTERPVELGDATFGRMVAKAILYGIPTSMLLITLGLFLATDRSLSTSFAAAALPGVLMGVFGGGFVGTAGFMLVVERSEH